MIGPFSQVCISSFQMPVNEAVRSRAQLLLRSLAFFIVLLACLDITTAYSQQTHATVRLDGRPLFRVAESETQSASERARQIEQRLMAVLESPRSAAKVEISPSSPDEAQRVITVGGRIIVTVNELDAAENGVPIDGLSQTWAAAIERALASARERRLSQSDRFFTAVRSSVETAFARLVESAIVIIPRAVAALLVLVFFWLLATAVRWMLRALFHLIISDLTIENLIKQVGYYAVWALGLLVAASAFGMEPQTVVTGLGLTSLALGFALKDILSNFVAGLLILTLRPFQLGDQIVIGETEGNVERIELRATLIRTYDGRMVSVPNSETFTSRVTNNTASPVRRGKVDMAVGYDTDLRNATALLLRAAHGVEGVLDDPPPSVRVRELEDDSIRIEVRFWTDSRRSDYVATASRVRQAVVELFRREGIALPDGILDVRMKESQ